MPNFDGTGPAGKGPTTGQRQGSCTENQQSNSSENSFARGRKKGCCRRGKVFQQRSNCISLDEQEKILENKLAAVRAAKQESNS